MKISFHMAVPTSAPAIFHNVGPAPATRHVVGECQGKSYSAVHALIVIALEYLLAQCCYVTAKQANELRAIGTHAHSAARVQEARLGGQEFGFVGESH
jgi:hypothetical protein